MTFVETPGAAEAYDRWFEHGWGKYAFSIEAKALLRAAGPLSGLNVLDVGCGTGRFTTQLGARGATAIGVDRDPSMLRVAQRRGLNTLALADACSLPFADSCFDVAFAVTLCEFVDNVEALFAELARVTIPGGRFIVGSLNPSSPWGFFGRKRFQHAPWTRARFLTRQRLLQLGSPYGRAWLSAALFAPDGLPAAAVTGPVVEAAGRLAPHLGAFQVLAVERKT